MEARKTKKKNTRALSIRLSKDIYDEFEKRCCLIRKKKKHRRNDKGMDRLKFNLSIPIILVELLKKVVRLHLNRASTFLVIPKRTPNG